MKPDLDGKPFVCMEFWIGWFDTWGGEHVKRDPQETARQLDEVLQAGHLNFYMFCGGTNFGFTSGSNERQQSWKTGQKMLLPDVTSYDYDALLAESGDITEKYRACQAVIKKYRDFEEIEVSDTQKKAYGKLKLEERVSLFNVLDDIAARHDVEDVKSMEHFGQNFGYILYRTRLRKGVIRNLDLVGAADRVHYFVNQTLEEIRCDTAISYRKRMVLEEDSELDLLVENMGRVNFGTALESQQKGIRGPVLIDGKAHKNFEVYTLPMDNLENMDFSKEDISGTPTFSRFTLEADESCDTFVDTEGFGKGFVAVNGFNLGRYWEIGPQKRLYLPGPLLKKGKNTIIVFESDGKVCDSISLFDEPLLGG